MTAPGAFVSGDVLTAADMNDLPGGLVARDESTLTVTYSATSTDLGVSATFTGVAGRLYLIVANFGTIRPDATQVVDLFIKANGLSVQFSGQNYEFANDYKTVVITYYGTFTGSTTITLEADATTSTGRVIAGSTRKIQVSIYDVGPS